MALVPKGKSLVEKQSQRLTASDPELYKSKSAISPIQFQYSQNDLNNQEEEDAIKQFENELKYPMIPDMKFAVEKVKSKFPVIIQKAGWAIALIIVVMYAALGLVGFLIFLFGFLTLFLIQAAIVFKYFMNEQKRVKERELTEDCDEHEDINPMNDEDYLDQFNDIDKYSDNSVKIKPLAAKNSESLEIERAKKRRVTQAVQFSSINLSKGRSAMLSRDSDTLDLSPLAKKRHNINVQHLEIDAKPAHRRRSSSATKKLAGLSKPAETLTLPETEQIPDSMSEVSPVKINKGSSLKKRKTKLPGFMSGQFEMPEIEHFYMLEDCKCRQRKTNEIKKQFEAEMDKILGFVKSVKAYYENSAVCQDTTGNLFTSVGTPSRSFLVLYNSSPLFDREGQIFTERFPQDFNDPFTYIKFINIRSKFQKYGQVLIDASTKVREELINGKLKDLEVEAEEIQNDFKTRQYEMSQRHEKITKTLRKAEQKYKTVEDELKQLLDQYNETIKANPGSKEKKEAQKNLKHAQTEASVSIGKDIQTQTKVQVKNYEELVALEMQCKLAHYKLTSQANVVKDTYFQFVDSIKEMERYKQLIVTQLEQIVAKKPKIFIELVQYVNQVAIEQEKQSLQDFQVILNTRRSVAMSPFGAEKGNQDNPEGEEINLNFISERSSESSSRKSGNKASKRYEKNSANFSDSEDDLILDDQEQNRRRTIQGSPAMLEKLDSELKKTTGPNVEGLDAIYVTEEDQAEHDDGDGEADKPKGDIFSSEMQQINFSPSKQNKSLPSEILQQYEHEVPQTKATKETQPREESADQSEEPINPLDEVEPSQLLRSNSNPQFSSPKELEGAENTRNTELVKKLSPESGFFSHPEKMTDGQEISVITGEVSVSVARVADNAADDSFSSPIREDITISVTKEDYDQALEKYNEDLRKYQDSTEAIKELARFYKEVAEANQLLSESLYHTIDGQFKKVKTVGAGVPIEIENDAASQLQVVSSISESKKYGPSTEELIVQSYYDPVTQLWQDCMKWQKKNAESFNKQSTIFKELEDKIEEVLQNAYVKCNGEVIRIEDLNKQVHASIQQLNSLTAKLEHVQQLKIQMQQENHGEAAETTKVQAIDGDEEVKLPPLKQQLSKNESIASGYMTPTLGHQKSNDILSAQDETINAQLTSKKSDPPVQIIKEQSNEKSSSKKKSHRSNSSYRIRVQKLESCEETEQPSLTRFDTMPDVGDEEPEIRTVKHSKSKSLKRQRSNSVDPLNMRSEERLSEIDFGEMQSQVLAEMQEQTQEESKLPTSPMPVKSPSQKSTGGKNAGKSSGWFGAITSWFTYAKEEELPDEQDLITMLDAEKVKLDLRIIEYIKATRNVENLFLQQRRDYQKKIISWKRQMVKNQITRAKDMLEYWNNDIKCELDLNQIQNTKINIVVTDLCDRKDGCITYHEPHCANYKLLEDEASPFVLPDIDDMDREESTSNFSSRVSRHSRRSSNLSINSAKKIQLTLEQSLDQQKFSAQKKRKTVAHMPSVGSILFPENTKASVAKESTFWVNNLLAVFHEAWKNAKVFQDLVCEAMYVPLNINRASNLGEIKTIGLGLEGNPPEIKWVKKSPNDDNADDGQRPHFAIDAEVLVPGKVKLLIQTEYKINWPATNWYVFPVKLEIIVSRISGTLRLQYSNDKTVGSFLQFLGRPAISIDVEPVLGEVSKINLKSIPTVKTLIKDIINKAVEELCYPNKVVMSVPCVNESEKLDASGKVIKKEEKGKGGLKQLSKSMGDLDLDALLKEKIGQIMAETKGKR